MKNFYNKINELQKEKTYIWTLYKYGGCLAIILFCLIFRFEQNEIMGEFSLVIILYSFFVGGYIAGALSLIFSLFIIVDMSTFFHSENIFSNIILIGSLTLSIVIIALIKSIQEKKQRQLLKRHNLYFNIINLLNNGVMLIDDEKVLFCNKRFEDILGERKLKGVENKKIYEQFEMEKEVQITKDNLIFNKVIKKNGGTKIYKVQIEKKIINKKSVTLIMIYDITKEAIQENAVLNAERYYNKLLQNMPKGILLHDNKKIIFANETILKMMKFHTLEEICLLNITFA